MATKKPPFVHTDSLEEFDQAKLPPQQGRVPKLLGVFLVLLFLIAIPAGLVFAHDSMYRNRIFSHVSVAGNDLSGETETDAGVYLGKLADNLLADGFTFSLGKKLYTIHGSEIAKSQLATFHVNESAENAYLFGRRGLLPQQAGERAAALTGGVDLPVSVEVDIDAVERLLRTHFADEIRAPQNAVPNIRFDADGSLRSASLNADTNGIEPDFQQAAVRIEDYLRHLENPTIEIGVASTPAAISTKEAEPHMSEVSALLVQPSIAVSYGDKSATLSRREIAPAIQFAPSEDGVAVVIEPKKLAAFFRRVGKEIEVPAVDGALLMQDGKVEKFIPEQLGVGIDEDAFAVALRDALYTKKSTVALATKTTLPEHPLELQSDLGIKELLGTGTSSFKKSPSNRIKNITNGVKKLNNTLIAPDEEFSLLDHLKPFDEENGWLPELVIKGDKIEPELGGGLCQIGTTTFRATMHSGLPVLERRNHSLVVSYYNDPSNGNPGTDATIFDPAPDFKFKNDTGHWMLFRAEILPAMQLAFSFYGTSDGRKGSYTPPLVSKKTTVPKETEITYMESEAVKPGKKLCEPSFPGTVASFTYTVELPDGTKTDRVFTSIYKMLPPICLVAPGELPPPPTPPPVDPLAPPAPPVLPPVVPTQPGDAPVDANDVIAH